ncbi:protein spinster isoform X2 [Diorhabda carinulata]|uniref:protein spinster isoform X2 n=1 Tax=Diorhabda sublineata TaxID=1163346 RepID=UPI0024E0BEAB|nr:protein spinster isoform X2 [Diorhabda sublineata]XP_057663414.1 protein spinster isoform X2 [Diorhabda carinulata]
MPSEKLEKVVMKPFKMDPAQNNSQQELVRENPENERRMRDVTFREWVVVAILCFVNLINYMDRFTIAGVLDKVKLYYGIQNDSGGLLQTAFILSYMLFAPIFGYLGDRYNRRYIMAFGVLMWSVTTLCGSFMTNFYWFIFFRALVGIGEASYSTIAPTIISDYFVGDIRSKMLAIFYFAIPVGSGMGYIIGSETADLLGQWQWALRVTPALGVAAVLLILFILNDPERGQSECSTHMEPTPWLEDLKDIVRNRSFMYSTAGFTCVAFVAGALSWWGPLFIEKGLKLQSNTDVDSDNVPFKFGVISMLAGLLGVPFGSYVAQKLRGRYRRIDANICAFGLLTSAPLVFLVCVTAKYNVSLCFTLVFFAEFFFNLTWSIIADILLYVVLPTRRSTAEGFQLLFSHALGDAGSPYLIGVLSELFKTYLQSRSSSNSTTKDDEIEFTSLQYALFSTCFVEIMGGLFFIVTAFYIVQDKKKVDDAVHGQLPTDRNHSEQQEQLQVDSY